MNKSNTIICAAKKCYSSLITHPNKNFFGFPRQMSLCKIWLENCGRTDLNVEQVIKCSHWRLCEDHFEDKWFTDSSKKVMRRKLNPVPTIFVNNISSLLPSCSELESVDVDCTLNPMDSLCVELIEDDNEWTEDTKTLLNPLEFSTETSRKNYNPNSESYNIDEICRFCMKKVSLNYVDIFSKTDDAKEIRKVSEIILPDKVSVCDGLPHKVCQKCIIDLKTCQKLIEQFRNADQCLRAIAKYSLFIESDDTADITISNDESENEKNNDEFIELVPKDTTVLPLSHFEKTIDGCLDEINIDESLEAKNNLNTYAYVITSSISDHSKNSIWEERLSKEVADRVSPSFKKHAVKFHKKYKSKQVATNQFMNEIIGTTQNHMNDDPKEINTCQMSNFGVVKSFEEISCSRYKCCRCSKLFKSNRTLEKHFKRIHGK